MITANYYIFGRDYDSENNPLLANGSDSYYLNNQDVTTHNGFIYDTGNILVNDTYYGDPLPMSAVTLTILSCPPYYSVLPNGDIIAIGGLPTDTEHDEIEYEICITGTSFCATGTSSVSTYRGYFKYLRPSVAPADQYVCETGGSFIAIEPENGGFYEMQSIKVNGVEVESFEVIDFFSATVYLASGFTEGVLSATNFTGVENSSGYVIHKEILNVANITSAGGVDYLCLGSGTLLLSNATPTGTWGSTNPSVATVNGSGVVTAVSEGDVTITYTVTNLITDCQKQVTFDLSIYEPVSIVYNVPVQTKIDGSVAVFSVGAIGSGNPDLTYEWEVCVDQSGTEFTPIVDDAVYSGSQTNQLSMTVDPSMNFYFFQCKITGNCGLIYSDLAVLIVDVTGIASEPYLIQEVCAGGDLNVTVTGEGDIVSYFWEEDQGGDNWTPIMDGTVGLLTYSGTQTNNLIVSGLDYGVGEGFRYRLNVVGSVSIAQSNPITVDIIDC